MTAWEQVYRTRRGHKFMPHDPALLPAVHADLEAYGPTAAASQITERFHWVALLRSAGIPVQFANARRRL
jgi:hypothetical protein